MIRDFTDDINDSLNIDQLYMLAHLCVDFMYELHEFYAEVTKLDLFNYLLYW